MPYAKVPLDNGESIQFYVPKGISPEQATSIAPTMWQYQQQGIDIMAPPPPPEKTIFGFGEEGMGRVGEIPKGIASGGLGLLGLGAEGIATLLLDNPIEEEAFVDIIRAGTEAAQSPFAAKYGYEDSLTRKLSEGLGSTVPFLATGFGGLGSLAAGSALGAGAAAGSAAQRARDAGATQEQIDQAALRGLPVGLSEILMPFGAAKVVKALRTQAKAGEEVAQTALKRIGRIASAGTAEGAQEAAAEVAQNMIAQDLYDPETGTFTGTGESFGVGAGVGGIIQGLLELAIPGRTRTPSVSGDDVSADTETPEGGTPPVVSPTEQQDLFDDLPAGAAPTSSVQEQQDALFALIDTPSAEELQQQYPAAFSIPLEELQKERTTLESLNIPDEATYDAIVAARTQPATSDAAQGTLDLAPADEPQGKGRGSNIRIDDEEKVFRADGKPVGESLTAGAEVLNKGSKTDTAKKEPDDSKTVPASIFGRQPTIKKYDTNETDALTGDGERISVIEDAARQYESGDVSEEVGEDQTVIDQREAAKKRDKEARERKDAAIKTEEAVDPKSLEEDPQTNLYEEFNEEAKLGQNRFGQWRSNIDTEALPIAEEDINNSLIVDYQNSKPPKINRTTKKPQVAKSPTPAQGATIYFRNYKNPASAIRAIAGDLALDRKTKNSPDGVYKAKELNDLGLTSRIKHAKAAEKFIRDNLSAPTIEALDAQIEDAARQYETGKKAQVKVTSKKTKETIANRKKLKDAEKQINKELKTADTAEAKLIREVTSGNIRQEFEGVKTEGNPVITNLYGLNWQQKNEVTAEVLAESPTYLDLTVEDDLRRFDAMETNEIIETVVEGSLGLSKNAVAASMPKVTTRVKNAIKAGNTKKVYELLSESNNPLIARMAKAIAENIGTTKIRFGKRQGLAGYFNPKDNTITIDPDEDVNAHVLLHEAGHAITSHVIADEPLNPAVRQLQKAYEYAKPLLGKAYGTKNLDEFVAEAYGNESFMSELNRLPYKSTKGKIMTVWEAVKRAFQNIFNRMIGEPAVEKPTNVSNIHQLIESIISPAPASRAAPILAMDVNAQLRQLGAQARQGALTKAGVKKNVEIVKKYLDRAPKKGWKQAHALLPLNALEQIYNKQLPSIRDLLREIQKKVGARSAILAKVKDTGKSIRDKLSGPNRIAKETALNKLVMDSTIDKVDPTKERSYYNDYWVSWEKSTGTKRESGALNYKYNEQKFDSAAARDDWISKNLDGKQGIRGVQKWGNDKTKVQKWEELQKILYNKSLSETDRKNVIAAYKQLRDSYAAAYDQMMDIVDDRLQQFDINSKLRKTISDKIFAKLKNKERIEPYFPLYRNGKYWLTFQLKNNAEPYKMLFATESERDVMIQELNTNPDLRNKVKTDTIAVSHQPGQDFTQKVRNMQTGAAFEILQNLKDNKAPQEIQDSIMEIMLDSMPETSVLQMFRPREGVLGADANAMAVYETRMPTFAQQIVNLDYGIPLEKIDQQLLKEVEADGTEQVRDVYNDSIAPYLVFADNPTIHHWSKLAKSLTFGYTLGANVSSVLVNSTNIPIVVYPVLGGRYGFENTRLALKKAMSLYMGSPTTRKSFGLDGKQLEKDVWDGWSLANWDYTDLKNVPEEYKDYAVLMEVMEARGQANRSTVGEMTDQDNPSSKLWQRFNNLMGFMFHQGERANRQVTGVAAFDLIKDKMRKDKKREELTPEELYEAANQAVDDIEYMNSGAMAETAPRLAQGNIGSVALMYKRFGISMAYLQARTILKSSAWIESNPDERWIMKKQIAGLFASSFLMAGIQGLPLYGLVSWIMNHTLFNDEGEDDFDTAAASWFDEGFYSGPLNYIFGLDIAPRIGMSNLLYRQLPNAPEKGFLDEVLEMAGGPFYGIASRAFIGESSGFDLLQEGQTRRGLEKMVPSFLANFSKAERFFREGPTTLRGDPITDSINGPRSLAQSFGLAPAGYIRQLRVNALEKRKERQIEEKRQDILEDVYRSQPERFNDPERLIELESEIIPEFNAKNPDYAITGSTIKRSLSQARRFSEEAGRRGAGGMGYSRRGREAIIARNIERLGLDFN